ncbi:YiiX/YebB-like N1pC/P60 family cysteine hydrolase [Halomonas getboli]|uniref:YiiX/YebB-like N1pC/P60 family cysteine hydrolase n=1 Tax=Halomonas getboli TaxID=2935862 RepID=UPI001FFFAC8C|nr:YiiX/YebB-like N1pC/P60 family cysteine hydrolase [Halomonas getboli]MCK2182529.1 lipo-like protein [Halomonas getboli]
MRRVIGDWLSRYLTRPRPGLKTLEPVDIERLAACLRPGDVLVVEGNTRISTAIKYLTQSTWSHAALYVGEAYRDAGGGPQGLIEADVREGVRRVGLDDFAGLHSRICRPVGLDDDEVARLIAFAGERLGERYDLGHVLDLARYLMPTPPVPSRWRRPLLSLGSGDPTRAICSTLIAQAFQSIRYPILPRAVTVESPLSGGREVEIRVLYPRHYSHFVPRDFDVSPYFQVIKPTLDRHFDHRRLIWGAAPDDGRPGPDAR